jgi:hypothetical protein
MTSQEILIEGIGWFSTLTFLYSIINPKRIRLHEWGMITSVATGIYGYSHGATAIWVKWIIAFFFHLYMWKILRQTKESIVKD